MNACWLSKLLGRPIQCSEDCHDALKEYELIALEAARKAVKEAMATKHKERK